MISKNVLDEVNFGIIGTTTSLFQDLDHQRNENNPTSDDGTSSTV